MTKLGRETQLFELSVGEITFTAAALVQMTRLAMDTMKSNANTSNIEAKAKDVRSVDVIKLARQLCALRHSILLEELLPMGLLFC